MAIRVLIVDDHSVVREGLRMFLARDPDLEVVGEAADGAEALEQARQMRPDVVVMDLLMPVMDGIAATQAIRRALPEAQCPLAISTVRGFCSTTRRSRSMLSNPLSSQAPDTSMPSASTKERWNCRAAMPRWR